MYRNNPSVREAWYRFFDSLCGDSTNWFCANRYADITWFAVLIGVLLVALVAFLFLKDRNKVKKLEKEHNMELDPIVLDIHRAIQRTKTTDPEYIIDDLNQAHPNLDKERVEECIKQLKKIGYLSKNGTPIT